MLDTLKESTVKETMLNDVLSMTPTSKVGRIRDAFFDLEPTYSIDRARIEARVMRETEGKPMVTRRAKVFAASVREMPIFIDPDELIVGGTSCSSRCANIFPGTWQPQASASNLPGLNDEEMRELNEDLAPYWHEQNRHNSWHYGHNIHNMKRVMEDGFLAMKKEAEERLHRLNLDDPDDLEKQPFLEGAVIVLEAASEIGGRYAAKAREMAGVAENAVRKAELLEIADICDRVPAQPAGTFREALQSYHFSWMMLTMELFHNNAFALGRMDQYLLPFYEKDLNEGRLTKEDTQELLDCYILKLNYVANGNQSTSGSIGVGGYKADGNDATNDLTYMFIESMMHIRMVNPWFAVFIHSKSPDDLLIKISELTALETGHPQILSADVGVTQMLARGDMGGPMVTLKDARDASNVGCLELAVPGKDSGYLYVGMDNLASYLELALNNGSRRSDGTQIGVPTGDPRQFESFEDVRSAFYRQVVHMRDMNEKNGHSTEQKLIDSYPMPYESVMIEGCIDKGLCREAGGAHYNFNSGITEVGSSDVADSLAAIKRLVFDEKKITMAQLCDALDANFEGHEDIRKMCEQVPKFGNDDDYVDEQKAWVIHQWASEFQKLTNLRGGYGCPGGSSMDAYVPAGKIVGALPSGRLAGEPLAPAGSPCIGKDVSGVTAVLKSMGKVDGAEVLAGLSLSSRIDPAVFKSREGMKRMADMLRTFVDQNIFHLQLNAISSETLLAAQESPKDYRDLMVKVAGYNAYFTTLNKELQDSIIARTEHGL
jgi:pyruvate formate-lyase/glycerol dehydratase family glycyl radical enzyme